MSFHRKDVLVPHESVNAKLYSISATSKGGRDGQVRSADGVVDLPLGKPNASHPIANPETLFAAGYAACFNGALNLIASNQGIDTSESTVTADVTFGKTDTGFGLAVDLLAEIPGVDAETAQSLADQAHDFCPYSKATRGNIDVTVTGKAV